VRNGNIGGPSTGAGPKTYSHPAGLEPNVVRVSTKRTPQFYIYLVKELFHKNNFDVVQLHGAGNTCVVSIARVVNTLTKRKYVAVARIKTGTIQGREGTKIGKFIVHLTKTDEFETIYDEFAKERAERIAKYEQEKAARDGA